MKTLLYWVAVVAVFVVVALLGVGSMRGDTATMDEQAHIPAAYSLAVLQDYRLNPEHPPLMKVLAGLPFLWMEDVSFPSDLPAWNEKANPQWELGAALFERNDASRVLFASRAPIFFLFLFFLLAVFIWIRRTWGAATALVALVLLGFSPHLLAHARYVTTDFGAAAACLLVVGVFVWFLRRPGWKSLIGLMMALAIAQVTKMSLLLLYPLILAWLLFWGLRGWTAADLPKRWCWALRSVPLRLIGVSLLFSVVVVGSLIGVWLGYIPVSWNTSSESLLRLIDDLRIEPFLQDGLRVFVGTQFSAFGTYVLGVVMVIGRVASGNTTYFLGEVTNQSFLWFYPVSFLLKTSLPVLVGTAALVVAGIRVILQKKMTVVRTSFVRSYLLEWMLASTAAFYGLVAVTSNLNLGLRHILPVYPLLLLLLARVGVLLWQRWWAAPRLKVVALALPALLVWVVGATVAAYPHFLAFTNVGTPRERVYHLTTDSNVDWGQDGRRLAAWVEARGIDTIAVDYFGGERVAPYLGDRFVDLSPADRGRTGWMAVSVTKLQGARWDAACCGEPDYEWLRVYEPVEVIGGSIAVFFVPDSNDPANTSNASL